MKNSFRATAFLLVAISVLGGCARSVQIVNPSDQSGQTLFVDFEVQIHPRADTSTFHADLDGQDIGAQFTIAGALATASMELSPGGHTVEVSADMPTQRGAFITDTDDQHSFTVVKPAFTFNPAPLMVGPFLAYQPGGSEPQTYSKTATVTIPYPLPQELQINITALDPFIFVVTSNNVISARTIFVPAGSVSASFNVWTNLVATGSIRANVPANTYMAGNFHPGLLTIVSQ